MWWIHYPCPPAPSPAGWGWQKCRGESVWKHRTSQQYHNIKGNKYHGVYSRVLELTCRVSVLIYKLLTVESQSPSEWEDWSHQTQKCKLYCWTPERSCLGCHWNYKHRDLQKGNIKPASYVLVKNYPCLCRPDVGVEDAPCRFRHHLVSAWLSPCNIKIYISDHGSFSGVNQQIGI